MQHGARTGVQTNDSTMEMPERWMKRGVHSGPHLPSISVCVLGWAPVLAPCFMVSCPNSPTEGDMWMKTALMNPTHNDSFIIFPNSPSSRGPHRDPGPSLESRCGLGVPQPDAGNTHANLHPAPYFFHFSMTVSVSCLLTSLMVHFQHLIFLEKR